MEREKHTRQSIYPQSASCPSTLPFSLFSCFLFTPSLSSIAPGDHSFVYLPSPSSLSPHPPITARPVRSSSPVLTVARQSSWPRSSAPPAPAFSSTWLDPSPLWPFRCPKPQKFPCRWCSRRLQCSGSDRPGEARQKRRAGSDSQSVPCTLNWWVKQRSDKQACYRPEAKRKGRWEGTERRWRGAEGVTLTLDVCHTWQGGTHRQGASWSEDRPWGASELLVMTTGNRASSRSSPPPPDCVCWEQTSPNGPPACASVRCN